MKRTLRTHVAAAMMLLAPLGTALVAQPAAAQHSHPYQVMQAQGRVTGMSLNSDAGLRPGATLRLQLYATPGARSASVALGNSGVRVALRERKPGEYVGTHVVRRSDRINPTELMAVRVRWGEVPVAVAFYYPTSFQALAKAPAPVHAKVRSFTMSRSYGFSPGSVLRFRVEGTREARAWVSIAGTASALPLREVRPGVYEGSYTVRRSDDPRALRSAQAVLRNGDQRVVAQLDRIEHYSYGYGR